MGEVDHRQNAVDHGVAQGDQRVDRAQLDAVDQLLEREDVVHDMIRIFLLLNELLVLLLNRNIVPAGAGYDCDFFHTDLFVSRCYILIVQD